MSPWMAPPPPDALKQHSGLLTTTKKAGGWAPWQVPVLRCPSGAALRDDPLASELGPCGVRQPGCTACETSVDFWRKWSEGL